jgi:integrase
VWGPYWDAKRECWRIVVRKADGTRSVESFASEAKAKRVLAAVREEVELGSVTVDQALDLYLEAKRLEGLREGSLKTTRYRLRDLLKEAADVAVFDLDRKRCQRLYDSLAARRKTDTHRNTLGQAKTWGRWLLDRGYVSEAPFATVKGIGRRNRGKPQLTGTEARALLDHCLTLPGDPGATGAVLCLVMGLRASEACSLQPRDLDAGVAWIRGTKTEAAARRILIPDFVAEYLAAGVPLGISRFSLLGRVKTLCRAAGVPEVPPHGLRGTFASLSSAQGLSPFAAMGHSSSVVTDRHYTTPDAKAEGQQRAALKVLRGGKG